MQMFIGNAPLYDPSKDCKRTARAIAKDSGYDLTQLPKAKPDPLVEGTWLLYNEEWALIVYTQTGDCEEVWL